MIYWSANNWVIKNFSVQHKRLPCITQGTFSANKTSVAPPPIGSSLPTGWSAKDKYSTVTQISDAVSKNVVRPTPSQPKVPPGKGCLLTASNRLTLKVLHGHREFWCCNCGHSDHKKTWSRMKSPQRPTMKTSKIQAIRLYQEQVLNYLDMIINL